MTKASVTKLHEADAEDALPMPGIDIGITANVGEQTQLQLKTMIVADTPDEIVNRVLDRMAGFAERMSAKSQILAFQAERTKFQDELSQMSADMDEVGAGLPARPGEERRGHRRVRPAGRDLRNRRTEGP